MKCKNDRKAEIMKVVMIVCIHTCIATGPAFVLCNGLTLDIDFDLFLVILGETVL